MSASDSAPKQETSDPPPTQPSPPHVLMQIAQLLAAQNIPIPSVPPPVTSAPIKPLAPSPSEPHLGNDLADEPLNNNDDLAKEPLNNNDEAPGKDLAEEPLNNDDEVSLASLDDQVHTKTSEVASPPSRSTSHQSTSTEPVELVTSVNDFDYQIGEPMDPPPHKRFLSMDDLVEFVRMWAKHHGYGISKGSSHAGKNIYIRCDRGGTYTGKLENLAKRDSSTRKCECAFQVKGSTSQAKGATDQSWHLVVMTGEHNHPASHCPSAHPSHRQLTKEQMEEVRKLSKSNVKTTQILLQLCQSDPETLAVNRTISNALHKIRLEDLAGQTPIAALFTLLKASNWVWEVQMSPTGAIQNLFFAHPGSVHLARIYHHVALLDATYKTNRYQLPLLHVVGQTATNKSFSIGFCFLMYENDEGYLWAVENLRKLVWKAERIPPVFITDRETALRKALSIVFPKSLAHLCGWHLNKNIVTNCKKHFPAAEKKSKSKSKAVADPTKDPWLLFWKYWISTSLSKSPDIYEKNLSELKQHLSKRPAVLKYLETSILPVKEHFIPAWASLVPHLRNLCTSRVESGHSFIKTFLTTSSGDLLSVWKSLSHAVDHQIAHVHESIGVDTIKTLTNVPRSFLLLSQKVSKHATLAANDQYKRLEDLNPTEPCSKTFVTGLGIPCAHKIRDILETRGELEPDDFHSQWRLDYNPESTIEEEPEFDLQEEISKIHLLLSHESASQLPRIFKQFHQIISSTHVAVKVQQPDIKTNPKGRPNSQKKRASNSTKRDPSAHEHAEAQLKKDQNKRAANKRAAKSRKKVKWSVGAADEEDKASEYGDDQEEEDKEEEEEQEMEERKKTTIKFRLPRKTIAMKAEEKGNMDEKKGDDILEDSPYFLEIPIVFRKYIRGIFNPEGDGNCGFRCIAKALGYDDDGWMQVREEMWKEAEAHRPHYSKLLGGEPTLEKILEGLGVSELTEKITSAKWLNKMDHGPMIANTYGRPVVFLSLETCGTFLPVRVGPKDSTAVLDPFYFVHVGGNHWVLAELQVVVDGVTPIPPVVGSSRATSQIIKAWKSHFKQQFALYNQEVKVKGKRA
ncbi:hypothetical protein MJO29_010827 [Puccinia striiformis f. sp. tritici]|nr:hypothetical protein MJO29_010827 [Puccinia striiformis f. sp. tritici]